MSGCSWGLIPNGARVRFHHVASDADHERAVALAEEIRDEVLAIEPRADVTVLAYPDRDVLVTARITGDAVAAFEGGPTHKKAASKLAHALSVAREKRLRRWFGDAQ